MEARFYVFGGLEFLNKILLMNDVFVYIVNVVSDINSLLYGLDMNEKARK